MIEGVVQIREQGPNLTFGSGKRDAPDETPRKHEATIRAVAWSPTAASMVATVSDDMTAIIWNTDTLAAKSRFFHDSPLRDCAYCADGHLLITAGRDMTIWNVNAEAKVRTLAGDGISTVKMPSVGTVGCPPACAFGIHSMATIARGCRHARFWCDSSPRDPIIVHITAAANRKEQARLKAEAALENGGVSGAVSHALHGHELFSSEEPSVDSQVCMYFFHGDHMMEYFTQYLMLTINYDYYAAHSLTDGSTLVRLGVSKR